MRKANVIAVALAVGVTFPWAGASAALGRNQPVRQPSGPYAVRCFVPWQLQDSLNARSTNGWKLVQLAPSECSVVIAGRDERRPGFIVVLER